INTDYFTYGPQEASEEGMEKLYQSWGIDPEKKIVIYDQGGTIFATRQFYSLYYYGFPEKNLFILDGGLAKWEENGLPVTKDNTPPSEKGSFKIEKLNGSAKAELPEFLTASGDIKNNILIEALGPDWHFGEQCAFDKAGHIPNAVMIPSPDFYNPDKTFKSPAEIKRMLDYLKIYPGQNIYTHCGGGISASVPFFALRFILHYPAVKLYEGSEIDWLSDERGLPYWTYDAPYLMRKSEWLQFWGGKMLRMFGRSAVSIIDVRTPEKFHEGHIPFAINIPAEVFKANINDPGNLVKILSRAGVNQLHEAVIVSDSGIRGGAALAFLVLEKLNQTKVSIFTDTMEKWSHSGYPLLKDTAAAKMENTSGLTVQPAEYSYNPRQEIITADLKSTQGVYAKVLIASGVNMSLPDDSNTVRVPYTDLLNPDGSPKEAKDIWNILNKAGIPRYGELICCSNNPDEAAVNYFILKLMGYPDIKVLIN
ncbi:MAG TPA: rhodanese-like domain-containing protein, partial [Ignavibacteriaceae bacterium]|nr:rhodanese-like domain-containing protein [Ignavibacteriaceae bacterium]